MSYILPLATFILVHMLAVISPGPSFVLTLRTAASAGRGAGLIVALAFSVGAVLWAAAALFGLQFLFDQFDWLYTGMRIAGGLFLIYLAIMMWLHAKDDAIAEPDRDAPRRGPWRIFIHALMVQLANPKVMVFFGSIFVALLPARAPDWLYLVVLGLVAFDEFIWYALVTLLFSGGPARAVYRRAKAWIDRSCGTVLGLLGLKLALDH